MTLFISSHLLLLLVAAGQSPAPPSHETSEPSCVDRGMSSEGAESVVAGEVGWLSCPLFSHSSVHNSTESAGHTPVWYRLLPGHHLEPIKLSWRVSRDRDRLWLQPANAADAGVYICVLRNRTSCSRISMVLTVLPSEQTIGDDKCSAPAGAPTRQVIVRLQEGAVLNCTDLEDATKMADSKPKVTWLYVNPTNLKCEPAPFWNPDREQHGERLRIHIMLDPFQGFYFCSVRYQRRGQLLNFTRRLNVTTAYPSPVPKQPSILHLSQDEAFPVRQSSEVRLVCRGLFPFLESSWWAISWTVDGQTLDKLPDHQRFYNINKLLKVDHHDRTEESVLVIRNFLPGDLGREFNCSVRNGKGFQTLRAELHEEARLPSVELGCGLGATLLLMMLLFVVYHVFWLELLLLYRSWFGTDERLSDDKEYDVYISYARNSEEEHFVLSTLRSVLENELGYSVCIFDRDSLPGGTITDETLSFVARSRRLLVVVSPGYASQGSQALLELKAGLDGMARGGHLRVILIQYRPVRRRGWVKELRRARVALALVRWRGDESRELTSRFWKRLRVELPVRRRSSREEAGLMRLHSQNSTCSQTGLLSNSCS